MCGQRAAGSGIPVYGDEKEKWKTAHTRPNRHNAGRTGRALSFALRAYVPSLHYGGVRTRPDQVTLTGQSLPLSRPLQAHPGFPGTLPLLLQWSRGSKEVREERLVVSSWLPSPREPARLPAALLPSRGVKALRGDGSTKKSPPSSETNGNNGSSRRGDRSAPS